VPLIYAPDGDGFVVTASNWGRRSIRPGPPICSPPADATVALSGGREIPVRATLAEGSERDRVWPLVTSVCRLTTRTSYAAAVIFASLS